MVFETKKIKSETLSEYLIAVRENLGWSLQEVSERSGVPVKFIQILENGKYHHLPATVYVLGFLKQLAGAYSIDSEDLFQQFKKERQIQEQVSGLIPKKPSLPGRSLRGFAVTPKSLSAGIGLLFVFFTIAYVIWQVVSINKTPALEISQPTDRQIVHDSYVNVVGKTDPGMTVLINDQNIFVDEKGGFTSQIGVGNGPKDLVFTAKNKFGKSVSKTLTVIGDAQIPSAAAPAKAVNLDIQCLGSITLSTSIDSQKAQSATCAAGATMSFTADAVIYLTTSDAGATKVTLNGKDLGVLGRPHEDLKDIPFSAPPTSQ